MTLKEEENDDVGPIPETLRSSLRPSSYRSTVSINTSASSDRDSASGRIHRSQVLQALTDSIRGGEGTPLLFRDRNNHEKVGTTPLNQQWQQGWPWFPGLWEDEDDDLIPSFSVFHQSVRRTHRFSRRSWRRRMFLLLTEPTTSISSAVFFVILIIAIACSNILMIMQTMERWQFVPDDCYSCGGERYYLFEDDNFEVEPGVPCLCPPAPRNGVVKAEDWIVYFFTVEWSLRVILYEPRPSMRKRTCMGFLRQWFSFLAEYTTWMDALAIFPYYAERYEKSNGLMSLRLLRLFRAFQLVRLGQYNSTFMSLTNVLSQSMLHVKLLAVVLAFGAAFFGSIVYWLEKGEWKYHEESNSYLFLRVANDGVTEEPSPFTSIPAAFWWFLVTATTVGYGDTVPTSPGGKCVAALAMLTGVLVIAFPVSVFSELWSRELKKVGVYDEQIEADEEEDGLDNHSSADTVPASVEQDEYQHTASTESVSEFDEEKETVEISQADLKILAKSMRSIDQHQRRIRDILARYDIET